jgi:hypothetical protein
LCLKAVRILRQKHVYVAWLVLHFLLIISVSCRETLRLIAQGPTILPSLFKSYSQKAESAVSGALGQHLTASNPIRQALATYLHISGIEASYGYFAPNVPGSYKLVFELHYRDQRVEYALPSASSAAAAFRIAGLLDNIGRTRSDPLREHLVKMMAQFIWREHSDVKTVRAIFGSISLPSVREFEHGKRQSYEFLYAYDFSLQNKPAKPVDR